MLMGAALTVPLVLLVLVMAMERVQRTLDLPGDAIQAAATLTPEAPPAL